MKAGYLKPYQPIFVNPHYQVDKTIVFMVSVIHAGSILSLFDKKMAKVWDYQENGNPKHYIFFETHQQAYQAGLDYLKSL